MIKNQDNLQGKFDVTCQEKFAREVLRKIKMPTKAIRFHFNRILKEAQEKEIEERDFYRLMAGEKIFKAHWIPLLYKATKDERVLDWMCNKCGYLAIPDYTIKSSVDDTKTASISIVGYVGRMFTEYRKFVAIKNERERNGFLKKRARTIIDDAEEAIRHIMGFVEKVRTEADL